jgi:hypothetical protein
MLHTDGIKQKELWDWLNTFLSSDDVHTCRSNLQANGI